MGEAGLHCASQLGREVVLIHLCPPPLDFLLHRTLFSVALQPPGPPYLVSFIFLFYPGPGGRWGMEEKQVSGGVGVIEDMGAGELLPQSGINRQGLATQVPKGRPRTPTAS